MIADEDELLVTVTAHADLGRLFGARHGPAFAARRMRKNVLELDLDVSMTPDAAARRAEEVLANEGAFIRTEPGGQDAPVEVIGLIAAGFGNLNPAVVTVAIRPSEYGSQLVVRGAAKEGLIKQRAGRRPPSASRMRSPEASASGSSLAGLCFAAATSRRNSICTVIISRNWIGSSEPCGFGRTADLVSGPGVAS